MTTHQPPSPPSPPPAAAPTGAALTTTSNPFAALIEALGAGMAMTRELGAYKALARVVGFTLLAVGSLGGLAYLAARKFQQDLFGMFDPWDIFGFGGYGRPSIEDALGAAILGLLAIFALIFGLLWAWTTAATYADLRLRGNARVPARAATRTAFIASWKVLAAVLLMTLIPLAFLACFWVLTLVADVKVLSLLAAFVVVALIAALFVVVIASMGIFIILVPTAVANPSAGVVQLIRRAFGFAATHPVGTLVAGASTAALSFFSAVIALFAAASAVLPASGFLEELLAADRIKTAGLIILAIVVLGLVVLMMPMIAASSTLMAYVRSVGVEGSESGVDVEAMMARAASGGGALKRAWQSIASSVAAFVGTTRANMAARSAARQQAQAAAAQMATTPYTSPSAPLPPPPTLDEGTSERTPASPFSNPEDVISSAQVDARHVRVEPILPPVPEPDPVPTASTFPPPPPPPAPPTQYMAAPPAPEYAPLDSPNKRPSRKSTWIQVSIALVVLALAAGGVVVGLHYLGGESTPKLLAYPTGVENLDIGVEFAWSEVDEVAGVRAVGVRAEESTAITLRTTSTDHHVALYASSGKRPTPENLISLGEVLVDRGAGESLELVDNWGVLDYDTLASLYADEMETRGTSVFGVTDLYLWVALSDRDVDNLSLIVDLVELDETS